jgi:hypothetical protein
VREEGRRLRRRWARRRDTMLLFKSLLGNLRTPRLSEGKDKSTPPSARARTRHANPQEGHQRSRRRITSSQRLHRLTLRRLLPEEPFLLSPF